MNSIRFSLLIMLVLLLSGFKTIATPHTISGVITDSSSGETLIGANIFVSNTINTTSDVYGFYSLTLEEGEYQVEFSFVGFQPLVKQISLTEDLKLDIALDDYLKLQEAVIESSAGENTDGVQMGTVNLEIEKIKTLPAFLGEVDILKTIQFLPGVQANGEGNAGFYVRGGGPDQNLILLDNATVYNASHLLGFFSVFNADAVKNIELIKGGIPAQYGGRLSSVLDINLKEGNNKEFHGAGGIGLIASRLTLEGPIKKDVSSFIISGRRTYADVLIKPFAAEGSQARESDYFFYDLNAKVNYKLSDKDQIYLSGYFGKDVFGFVSPDAGFGSDILWGNTTGTFRWNHQLNQKLTSNTTVTFSDFQFDFLGEQADFKFRLFSGIQDWNFKNQFSYYHSPRSRFKMGLEFTRHKFTPSNVEASSDDVAFDTGEIQEIFSREYGAYVNHTFDLSQKLKLSSGLRVSAYQHVGPFTRFIESDDSPENEEINYEKRDVIAEYAGLEPRLSLRYKLTDESSLKLGFNRNMQYVHLASFSSLTLPTDTWLPSTDVVKPENGSLLAIGYFRDFSKNKYETSVELYYKTMNNLIEYEDGASPDQNVNNNIDNQLVFGSGTSYGAEFFLKKKQGKLNGWIGYTWSKTDRRFPDLNDGLSFPAKYDRRHDFSAVSNFELNEHWTFSGAFVFSTGNTFTPPVSWYVLENRIVFEYADRNTYRMPNFHRFDLSATRYSDKTKEITVEDGTKKEVKKKLETSWTFSIYNAYNRKNPFFIYYANTGSIQNGDVSIQARQVSLFPILPSVTWNFKF